MPTIDNYAKKNKKTNTAVIENNHSGHMTILISFILILRFANIWRFTMFTFIKEILFWAKELTNLFKDSMKMLHKGINSPDGVEFIIFCYFILGQVCWR